MTDVPAHLSPQYSPRSYQEQLKLFSGSGSEAYRSSFGIPEDRGIAWELQCMRERVLATSRGPNSLVRVPDVVQHKYHSLLVLDSKALPSHSEVLGYKTCTYKSLSTTDPYVYCLRRVEGFRLSNFDLVQDSIEKWSMIKHPNIVAVRQAFATSEFQDIEGAGEGGSLVYVYDYIDMAQTVEHWQVSSECAPMHETLLWDIILQVCMGLRLIHSKNLAARCIHPNKILISSRFRIHINCVGLLDSIQHKSISNGMSSSAQPAPVAAISTTPSSLHNKYYMHDYPALGSAESLSASAALLPSPPAVPQTVVGAFAAASELQRADLYNLGKVVLSLASGVRFEMLPSSSADLQGLVHSMDKSKHSQSSSEGVNRTPSHNTLSSSLICVLELLLFGTSSPPLSSTTPVVSAEKILSMCGSYLAYKAEQLQSSQDLLFHELRKTIDSSRIYRVLSKISCVVDRPYLLDNWRWSSTGDRLLVQLFRDYVFFQTDEAGRPFLDSGHITDCLAKVDVGSFEPIMLMNRDASSVVVSTYNDIRRCIETCFKEIADTTPHRMIR